MILEAFWKGDNETLDWLTEDHVRDAFGEAIKARGEAGHVLDNRLVAIERALITEATIEGGRCGSRCAFDADIAAVTRDGEGNLIAGSTERRGDDARRLDLLAHAQERRSQLEARRNRRRLTGYCRRLTAGAVALHRGAVARMLRAVVCVTWRSVARALALAAAAAVGLRRADRAAADPAARAPAPVRQPVAATPLPPITNDNARACRGERRRARGWSRDRRSPRSAIDRARAAKALAAFRLSCRELMRRTDQSGLTRGCRLAARLHRRAIGARCATRNRSSRANFETVQVGDGKAFATGYYDPRNPGLARAPQRAMKSRSMAARPT